MAPQLSKADVVRQLDIDLFWSKVVKGNDDECWGFKGNKDRDGYYSQSFITAAGHRQYTGAHRFMMIMEGHTIPVGYVVMHKCDNPSCVNPNHLRIGTVAENNLDKKLKGRSKAPKGERQGNASLTNEQAREIRAKAVVGYRVGYNNGSNIRQVAEEYGVPRELVRRIARNELYKDI